MKSQEMARNLTYLTIFHETSQEKRGSLRTMPGMTALMLLFVVSVTRLALTLKPPVNSGQPLFGPHRHWVHYQFIIHYQFQCLAADWHER